MTNTLLSNTLLPCVIMTYETGSINSKERVNGGREEGMREGEQERERGKKKL